DRAATFAKTAPELAQIEIRIDGIEPQSMIADVLLRIVSQVDDPEQPHVLECQFRSGFEFKHDASEARLLSRICVVPKVAGHPEMQMQPVPLAGRNEQMLSVPPNLGEFLSGKAADQRPPPGDAEDPLIDHANARDALLQRMSAEVPRVHLDFGQFRHEMKCTMSAWPAFPNRTSAPLILRSAPCSRPSVKSGARRCSIT